MGILRRNASLPSPQEALPGRATRMVVPATHYAEEYHQQYLAKNPGGYCGLGGTGIRCAAPSAPTP